MSSSTVTSEELLDLLLLDALLLAGPEMWGGAGHMMMQLFTLARPGHSLSLDWHLSSTSYTAASNSSLLCVSLWVLPWHLFKSRDILIRLLSIGDIGTQTTLMAIIPSSATKGFQLLQSPLQKPARCLYTSAGLLALSLRY